MDHDLSGTVAFVTGGGRGIGRAAALALAEAGAAVAVTARSEGEIDAVAREIDASGGRALALAADVVDTAAVERAARAAEAELGPVDTLVCNAGTSPPPGRVWEADSAAWWRTMEVNVLGVVHSVGAVVPAMVERGRGRVIHTGSLVGVYPSTLGSAYAASKAALLRVADCLALELEGTGVVSIAMSPGLVRTAMTAELEELVEIPEEAWVPIERSAELVVRLAAGDADALSGLMVHASDDLDALVDRADEIREKKWYSLRMIRGLDDPEPI